MDNSSSTPLTKDSLRLMIAESMGLEPDLLPSDDEDLIDHGLHSVAVMQVVSRCHRHGIEAAFPELIAEPTVDGWWRLLSAGRPAADR
ncbi:phosphopantetheine-binding protein [Kitasatospora sp. NPDC048540]|uniref:phosphopantetheine-binding protein n=1 Tax=Kitasatospora sp. NPDC048540 TaxID=3155634 RepID=UPI00341159BB